MGGGFHALGLIPAGQVRPDISPKGRETLKAPVAFSWLQVDGSPSAALAAQLILYPDYPEVRLSGILQGSPGAPSALVNSRAKGRVLFFGITDDRRVIGAIAGGASKLAHDFADLTNLETTGVFTKIPLLRGQPSSKEILLRELRRIHKLGWLRGKALNADGSLRPCNSSNCVGYTLEAELGVFRNGSSEPDFLGWELKAGQANAAFEFANSKAITLLTPEPNVGFYSDEGPTAFIRRFGYPDTAGRADRLNFGGIFRVGSRNSRTGLTLEMGGYDSSSLEITDANGSLQLRADDGTVAAGWSFAKLATHWNRKHAQAAYVAARHDQTDGRRYR